MNYLLFIYFLFSLTNLFGQVPFSEDIETESSNINIIRNSIYKVYKETYKYNDSIWYSVSFIDDTTQLNTEGWKLRNGRHLGIWKEFNREGELMYTWNHDKHTCIVNPKLFPYHEDLKKMKLIADNMIIQAYGREFMDKHIIFNFKCFAYNRYKIKYNWSTDSTWTEDYLGSWTEPLKCKPNSFLLRYEVRLNSNDEKSIELGIYLDEFGNYVPSADDWTNNYGFEKINITNKKFIINKDYAIEIAKLNGLLETDNSKISEFLFWENFKKQEYFNGQFRYYIAALIKQEEYSKGAERKGVINRFQVFVFNPWTGEFVEKKKMKSIREWGKLSGHSTGLLNDKD
ncbi:MAG TPA: hypothetical protein PK006_08290 [Saprospiraceae bacterium]|nr:hypothetical protein [Saprospiraceae bacterium]